MEVEAINQNTLRDFITYCSLHKDEVDDSFLYDDDLQSFEIGDDNPTSLVYSGRKLKAVASLILDDYHRRGRKARFRILHSETKDIHVYFRLLNELLKHTRGLDEIFLFIPVINSSLINAVTRLTFKPERSTYLLVREDLDVTESVLDQPYEFRAFIPGIDEESWCEVRNRSFATLRGSETPITPEIVSKMVTSSDYLDGGLILLYHGAKPVGIVRCTDDEYEGSPIMNIGPLAVIPEYQGKGLGRILLRRALFFAKEKGYKRTVLCVNEENENAKSLYFQEGFRQVEAVTCFKLKLKEQREQV